MKRHDLIVIGGGSAGLAAAVAAKSSGIDDVLLIERDGLLGGILNQCIHDGFGLQIFKEALSGPEYAARYIEKIRAFNVNVKLNTMVLHLSKDKILQLSSEEYGIEEITAKAVVLAMGCRERTRGALSIPGHRPSGIFTAGVAQNLINMQNIMPGKRICILGSGDIGLIMARRMTLEGAKVDAVFEILPQPSGLARNIRACLDDYGIPLYLNTTVTDIVGMGRLEGVWTSAVNNDRCIIKGSERFFPCDTLLLSVGLIPENELSREAEIPISEATGGPKVDNLCMTGIPGIFACGNVLHVHDLVDTVSTEAERVGRGAAGYIRGIKSVDSGITAESYENMSYDIYQKERYTCVVCPSGCQIEVSESGISGYKCDRGIEWVKQEMKNPLRTVTSNVLVCGGNFVNASVRTTRPIPLSHVPKLMEMIREIKVNAPVGIGQILLSQPMGINTDIIFTRNVKRR
ncbi:MAG: FAD-dependent oxidoreductase [Synergistaceae bacterium]|nr:FAD-dependent oxidoreductase [Synergistaceae bacterium]